jgi:alpha-N-arabinofuranosidase
VPNINAGSPTYPIDVAAALSADGTTLTVAVVNPSESAQQLKLELRQLDIAGPGTVWRMAPGRVTAANVIGRPPEVRIEESAAVAGETLTVPAISVGIYAFPLKR